MQVSLDPVKLAAVAFKPGQPAEQKADLLVLGVFDDAFESSEGGPYFFSRSLSGSQLRPLLPATASPATCVRIPGLSLPPARAPWFNTLQPFQFAQMRRAAALRARSSRPWMLRWAAR